MDVLTVNLDAAQMDIWKNMTNKDQTVLVLDPLMDVAQMVLPIKNLMKIDVMVV